MEQQNNLDTYRILFLVKGILTILLSLLPLLYVFLGGMLSTAIENDPFAPPFNPGIIFIVFGTLGFIFLLALGILTLLTSKFIGEHKNYSFIFVMAILNALTGVLGILLCVFSLIEINKPEVKKLFGK